MARSVQAPAHKALRILATLLTYCASYPRRGMPTTIAVAIKARVAGRKQGHADSGRNRGSQRRRKLPGFGPSTEYPTGD